MRFPQEETGRQRKLSRPWFGPYRVLSQDDPDITVVKVYRPQDGQIQIHQSRVKPCPNFPAGFFWYGTRRHGPGRLPKWIYIVLRVPLNLERQNNQLQSLHTRNLSELPHHIRLQTGGTT